jgi:mannose-6-phosphate isomerase-like protein (cupin superfamily)
VPGATALNSGYLIEAGQGARIAWPGVEITTKASGRDIEHDFSLLEDRSDEITVPLHVHHDLDEAFYVLDGCYRIACAEDVWEVGPGGFVYLPRGTSHSQDGGLRKLVLTSPAGGLEGFFEELAEAINSGTISDERRVAIGRAHGLEWLPNGTPRGEAGYVLGAGEGETISWPGVDIRVKASSEQTGGRFALLEDRSDEMIVPLHVHQREDEAFYVLEGRLTVRCGDRTFDAGPGSFVFLPRGVPHGHTVAPEGARKLILLSPGGFEGFFREMAAGFAADMSEVRRDSISAAHGVRFLAAG